MWQTYYRPGSLAEALDLLAENPAARVVAGGTDLTVELRRGIRPTDTLVDLSALPDLRYVTLSDGIVRIGALATHNDLLSAPFALRMLPLWQASREVGAPQIRAAGTIAGNLVTASPANDTITALIALGAEVDLMSRTGSRTLALSDFYLGVRRTALQPGELLREIRFPALRDDQRGLFLKLGLRRAQAIAVVNTAIVVTLTSAQVLAHVAEARIALGCVAPTIVRADRAEAFLAGRVLDPAGCAEAGRLATSIAQPIDDIRGSASYRTRMVATLVARGLERIAAGRHADGFEAQPVLLETLHASDTQAASGTQSVLITTIETTINGEHRSLVGAQGLTLLDALREIAGITGVKEGCAEGECGACTVWLDDKAVMACLTPAARAHGSRVTTIEGLAGDAGLHSVQRTFVEQGAVQCGFCTPGFLMAAARLLEEHPNPSPAQIRTAISGNLCRCTGYSQIQRAIQSAADPHHDATAGS